MEHVEHSPLLGDAHCQIPLRILQQVGEPSWLPDWVMERVHNEADAFAYCWAMRRIKAMTVTEAARHMGVPKSHLSQMLSGKKYPKWDLRIDFQRLCGNWGLRQYDDRRTGFTTVRESKEQTQQRRIHQLEQQVNELQAARKAA